MGGLPRLDLVVLTRRWREGQGAEVRAALRAEVDRGRALSAEAAALLLETCRDQPFEPWLAGLVDPLIERRRSMRREPLFGWMLGGLIRASVRRGDHGRVFELCFEYDELVAALPADLQAALLESAARLGARERQRALDLHHRLLEASPHKRNDPLLARAARALAVIVALIVALPAVAHAGAADDIAAANKHWRELDYELVVKRATAALADRSATRQHKLEALALLGSALAVLGRAGESAEAFTRGLALDPDFDLPPGTSPRILAVFRPARARWLVDQERELAMELGPSVARLEFEIALPPSARGGRSLPVDIRLTDPGSIAEVVVVHYRRTGDRVFSATRARARPTMRVEIPPAVTASKSDYRLELYVELQHKSKITLARRGTAERPLSIPMTAGAVPGPTPVTQKWWFWAGAAAIATAAISIPILIDRARDVGPQDVVGVRP